MKKKQEQPAGKSWFNITATGDAGRYDVYIEEAIGGWDVDAKTFVREWRELPPTARVDLHVSSPGGSVFEGIDIYNIIKAHQGQVTAHVGSMAASMASVIILAADVVKMSPAGMMMIHSPSITVYGNSDGLLSAATLLDKLEGNMLDIYAANSTKTREEIAAALKAETWLTAQESVDWGFADEIEKAEEKEVSASFDLSAYGSVPAQVKASQKRDAMTLEELKAKAEEEPEEAPEEPQQEEADDATTTTQEAEEAAIKAASERAATIRSLTIEAI